METCSEPISTACSTNRGWRSPLARSRACAACPPEGVVGAAGAASAADHRAREFDRLADAVRGAFDMEYLYHIIEEGV